MASSGNVALLKAMPKGDPKENQCGCLLCLPSGVPGLLLGWQQVSQDKIPQTGVTDWERRVLSI